MVFDSINHTTAGLPHIVGLLVEAYKKDLAARLERLKAKGGAKFATLAEAYKAAPVSDFVKFADDYLRANRPVQSFAVDLNHGLMLSNHVRCVVSPGAEVRGGMQASGAVGVNRGESQPGMGGTVPANEIKVI